MGKGARVALFDFDGTLSGGYISMEFMDYLYKNGIYPARLFDAQAKIYDEYKRGLVTYETWCEKWGEYWAEGLKGRKAADMAEAARDFFKTFKRNIHMASFELVDAVRDAGYRPVMVSTGAYEVASLAASELGMLEVYATKLRVSGGVYTGDFELKLHLPGSKLGLVKSLGAGADLGASMAFGDSASDIGMLEAVGIPVALNPNGDMRSVAAKNGWTIATSSSVLHEVRRIIGSVNSTETERRKRTM